MLNPKKSYKIARLLETGIQPFDNVTAEELNALSSGIRRGQRLADPVTLSRTGQLIDGHQRLRAMMAQGLTMIDAKDTRILDNVSDDNALEWAVRLNAQRRHLTVEAKAAAARRLMRQYHWSQGKVAAVFGVSRPAVNQWLAQVPDPDPTPITVTGEDGKKYPGAIEQPTVIGDPEPEPPSDEKDPDTGPPKKRRKTVVGPAEWMNDRCIEWGDPELRRWVLDWAADAHPTLVDAMVKDLADVAAAAERIAEDLRNKAGL